MITFWQCSILAVLFALLAWQRRRRRRRRHEYPYEERAAIIEQALRENADVAIIYWSQSHRRYLRMVVIPEALENRVLMASDRGQRQRREFHVSQLKKIMLMPNPALVRRERRHAAKLPVLQRAKDWIVGWGALLGWDWIWGFLMILIVLAVGGLGLRALRRHRGPVGLYYYAKAEFSRALHLGGEPNAGPSWIAMGTNQMVEAGGTQALDLANSEIIDAPPPASMPNKPYAYFQRARLRAHHGDLDGALEDYGAALQLEPSFVEAYLARAQAFAAKHDLKNAVEDCGRAIALKPYHAGAYRLRAVLFQDKGDLDDAVRDFTKLIELTPHDPDVYGRRAWAKCLRGDYDGAIVDADKAIALRPLFAGAFVTRGWAKYVKGETVGGAADCTQALKLNPDYAYAHAVRGMLYFDAKHYELAEQEWAKAIALQPSLTQSLKPWFDRTAAAKLSAKP